MERVTAFYQERITEIDSFLELIEQIQIASQDGIPHIGEFGVISADHQKILISSAYIQLYSLVESTISQALDYVAQHLSSTCKFEDLNDHMRREWADFQIKTYSLSNITDERRSNLNLKMSNHIANREDLLPFKIEKRNAKGWDRKILQDVVNRIGVEIQISEELDRRLKIHYSNDMEPLTFLKIRRSQLAHGEISFTQSGESKSIDDLKDLRNITCEYLSAMLGSFQVFLEGQSYKRAAG